MRWRSWALVRQHDERDCGPAALASVALHYGVRIPQARLRDLVGTDIQGSALARLKEAAERMGFLANAGQAKPGVLDKIPLPTVAHVDRKGDGHFVVVYEVSPTWVTVADPALGVLKLPRADFEKMWTGGLLLLAATDRIDRRRQGGGAGSRLLRLILQEKADLLTALGCSAVATVLGMSQSLYLQLVVDRVLPRGDSALLLVMLLAMLAVILFRAAYGLIQQAVTVHLGRRITLRQGLGFAQHLLSLPQRYFDTHTSGDVLSRLTDVQQIRQAVGGTALSVTMDAGLLILTGSVLFLYHPGLALLTVLVMPLLVSVTLLIQRPIVQAQRSMMQDYGRLTTRFVDTTVAMRTIKGFTAEREMFHKIEEDYLECARSTARIQWLSALGQALGTIISTGASAVLLYYGSSEVLGGRLTTGQLFFFSSMLGYLLGPAQRLADALLTMQEAAVSVDRLDEVFLVHPEQPEGAGRRESLKGEIEFRKVTFGYDAANMVLKEVSLKVEAGTTVALVGETGSGKTTLASLVCGFYIPQEGEILLDGHNLRDLDLKHARGQMAVVFQDNYLVSGSIRENLRLAGPEVSTEDIEQALRRAEAWEFIRKLPRGMDYDVGHQGSALSSGQRQRLAIARALARKPRLLVLDEATSNLDSVTEQAVVRTLWEDGRTTLLIAHRLSTIRHADRIVVLDAGRIVEQGTHEALLALKGRYHALWNAQRPESPKEHADAE